MRRAEGLVRDLRGLRVRRECRVGRDATQEIERGEQRFHACAAVLDGWLRDRQWLAGDGLTLADVSVGAWLSCSELGRLPVDGYREIARWQRALAALPAWQSAYVNPLAA